MTSKEEPVELDETMAHLTRAIEQLNRTQTMWYGFWHGLVVGLGSTVGVAIIVSVIVWLLTLLNFVPGIQDLQNRVAPYLDQRR